MALFRKLLIGGGVGVLAFASVVGYQQWQAHRDLAHEIARIREAGEPLTVAELEDYFDVSDARINAGQPLVDAIRTLNAAYSADLDKSDGLPFVSPVVPIPVGEAWPDLPRAKQFLADLNQPLAKVREELDCDPAAMFPLDNSLAMMTDFAFIPKYQSTLRILRLQVHVQLHERNLDGALESIRCIIRLARQLRTHPDSLSQLIGIEALTAGVGEYVLDSLPSPVWTDALLRELQAELRGVNVFEVLRHALIVDRVESYMIHDDCRKINVSWRLPLSETFDRCLTLRHATDLLGHVKPPMHEVLTRCGAHEAQAFRELDNCFLSEYSRPVSIWALGSQVAAIDSMALRSARLLSCDAALAIELYRRQHGDVPTDWNQLVPKFLPEVPIDPFDGQPLRIAVRPLPDGGRECVVYSIGPDLKDDGAQPAPDTSSHDPDLAMRLRIAD